ncbi:MAG: type II toxin-antitoxin system VapC family toxin [Bradyrhizobiaceae bacterium]|nr:type II toxin-antitoxin system VapC family toxin [Bradyrhizobiaceae bacterium]
MILLDTHAAIWLATGQGLGRQSKRLIDKALSDDGLAISAISFWELAMLIAKRRLRAVKSAGEQRSKMLSAGIRELPLTGETAILAAELESLHGDPADRMIAATAIAYDATLITADANLLRWRHPLKRQDAEK